METKAVSLQKQKNIALIAHDTKKQELCEWAVRHKALLAGHRLCATGTTGHVVQARLGLPVEKLISGPLGGDQQIGARIPAGEVDVLIFFWDPFESMPHDPDIKALLRIAAVWNIPVACNSASADFIVNSPLFGQTYTREVPDYDAYIAARTGANKCE